MKRLIIYDLDGTLVDTLQDLAAAVNHMLRICQAPPLTLREVRGCVGRGVRELVRRSLQTDEPKRLDDGVKVFLAYYERHLLDQTRLYPGAREVLEHFKDRRQAVLTNKPNPFSRDILEALGVAPYLFELVAGDTEFPKKPDPSAVLALMRVAEASAEETLMVGDSPIDVETGRAAGVFTVCALHGLSDEAELAAANPDLLVKDFGDLLSAATQHEW
jgi:phosphoglycolate phosphatase